ncbi:MAG: hypothetical protein AB7F96_06735 [Beijerinckiaceae bacterium]
MKKPEREVFAKVANRLGLHGFSLDRVLTHAVSFCKLGRTIYLNDRNKIQIVVDPRVISTSLSLGKFIGKETWNSNFSGFPKKMRGGANPEVFGIGFDLENIEEIDDFVTELSRVL